VEVDPAGRRMSLRRSANALFNPALIRKETMTFLKFDSITQPNVVVLSGFYEQLTGDPGDNPVLPR